MALKSEHFEMKPSDATAL